MRKLILKKLVATELILFKSLFQIREQLDLSPNTKQKAISPPAELLTQVFPDLDDSWRGRIDVRVFGPIPGRNHLFRDRSLSKQDKNWRIEGDIDDVAIGSPYLTMRPDDYAVLDFRGKAHPESVDIYLLSNSQPDDRELLRAVRESHAKFAQRSRSRTSAAACLATPGDILAVLDPYAVPEGHPLLTMLAGDEDVTLSEEVALGQLKAAETRRRAGRRPLNPEEFRKALERREEIGRRGEQLVQRWLEASGIPHRWVSSDFPGMPYDFEIHNPEGIERLEVKSTGGAFDSSFRMSYPELMSATDVIPYNLLRVYEISSRNPAFRAARAINSVANNIVGQIMLPDQVRLSDVWIEPAVFHFDEEYEFNSDLL